MHLSPFLKLCMPFVWPSLHTVLHRACSYRGCFCLIRACTPDYLLDIWTAPSYCTCPCNADKGKFNLQSMSNVMFARLSQNRTWWIRSWSTHLRHTGSCSLSEISCVPSTTGRHRMVSAIPLIMSLLIWLRISFCIQTGVNLVGLNTSQCIPDFLLLPG